MKIIHIITSLGDGGAENTLYKICKYDKCNEHIVICLTEESKYFFLLKKINIEVFLLNLNFFSVHKIFYLIRLLYNLKPDIVQTWLLHADLIGGLAARIIGIKRVIWNIRYSKLEFKKSKISSIIIIKLLTKLSFIIPKSIIVVSKKAKKIYEKKYDKSKIKYIPNGYDLEYLKPNKLKKNIFKNDTIIKNKIPIIGNVARYDPQKDHFNLLKALSLLKSKNIDFFCVLAGNNINSNNSVLMSLIDKLKLKNKIKLLGQKDQISDVMDGLDLFIQSSSYGEGFPNVVAEAMSFCVPCVVTDVGDSSLIVGKTGWVVQPKNFLKMAQGIEEAINEIGKDKWYIRCKSARYRIQENYSIEKMLKRYNKLWKKVYKNK